MTCIIPTTQSQIFPHHTCDPLFLWPPPTLLPSGNRCAAVCVPELQFSIPHVSETMWFLTFSVWRISLSLFSRSIQVVANGSISSFLRLSSVPLYTCTTCYPIIYQRALQCFQVLATLSNAAMNIGVRISFWNNVFKFWGYPEEGC